MDFRYDVVALSALFAIALVVLHRWDKARIRAARGAYFSACLTLVDGPQLSQDDVDFPALDGRYRGHRVRLQPVVDHVAVRKIPSLWLLVTVFGELPGIATLDLLIRPQNLEFYSPSSTLPVSLKLPLGWPAHAILKTDEDGDRFLPVEPLTPHMRIFEDTKMKELVVTTQGVRLVYQASEADRAYYMVLRHAKFSDARLSTALAQGLLDQAIAIYNTVAAIRRTEQDSLGNEPPGAAGTANGATHRHA
jgi:hypothetical protein